jgi:predicted RecA/RadA family phage recombinase
MPTLKQAETDVWDYTPSGAKAAGDLVFLGKVVGVVCRPIAANAKGAIAVRGVFTFDKVTGGALAAGAVAYLHSNLKVTGSASTTGIAGIVAVDAAAGDTTVDVSINHGMLYDLNVSGPA